MSFNFKPYENEIIFVPLGGSNEIGMNLNLYRHKGKWLMIDMGIGFTNDYLPGADVIVPDTRFIEDVIGDDLVGLVLTHAHEDHLGAVPYLYDVVNCPIYATAFTANVLKAKLKGEGIEGMDIREVEQGSHLELGPFKLDMIDLTHSIPEMQAIAITTDAGVVMHTGDWKLDPEPVVGAVTDKATLTKFGDAGVMAMVCDSTNVFVEGTSGSEAGVKEELFKKIAACENRVVVSTFASNLARLESIIKAGEAAGRKIFMAGRSFGRIVGAAKDSGYLKDCPPLLDADNAMSVPRGECMIIATGCQGEPRAALSRMACSDHPKIRLAAKDTVIFSSKDIPGNESRIAYMQNQLVEMNVEIITAHKHDIHVSGHPAREELTEMYKMVQPAISVPVHGEARHLREHMTLATSLGVKETVKASNGAVILLKEGEAKQVGTVDSGYIAVDGKVLTPTDSKIFGQRRRIRDEGIIFIALAMEDNRLIEKPGIIAPGCLDARDDADILEEMAAAIDNTLEDRKASKPLEQRVRTAVRKIVKAELGKRPLIEISVLRV
ncbi:MAG: ribonuclease J [Rickettsiales bacterium]|nr:ribonuclease J [Rickettsiales bacterium]